VHQLENQVLDVIDARCKHEVYSEFIFLRQFDITKKIVLCLLYITN